MELHVRKHILTSGWFFFLLAAPFAAAQSHLFSHQTAIIANCAPSLCGKSFNGGDGGGESLVLSHLEDLFISTLHTCSLVVRFLELQDSQTVQRWLQSCLTAMTTESNPSHTSPRCNQPASLRLKTSSCCDWWEIQRVCNISERTFHWSSRTCRAEPKQRDFCLAENPSPYFLVNRCRPARRDRVKPTTNTWKKLWHTQRSSVTEINMIFRSGSFRGDVSCIQTHTKFDDFSPSQTNCSTSFCMQEMDSTSLWLASI